MPVRSRPIAPPMAVSTSGKTDPVVQAAAVLIGTLVGGPPQELVDQIAIAAVYFRRQTPPRSHCAPPDGIGDNTLDIRPGDARGGEQSTIWPRPCSSTTQTRASAPAPRGPRVDHPHETGVRHASHARAEKITPPA